VTWLDIFSQAPNEGENSMNKQEAEEMRQKIAQDMPVVTVEIITKNHHNSTETCTLKVLHTRKKRVLQFADVETWEYIYCAWSV
jgi:hypothetical protein